MGGVVWIPWYFGPSSFEGMGYMCRFVTDLSGLCFIAGISLHEFAWLQGAVDKVLVGATTAIKWLGCLGDSRSSKQALATLTLSASYTGVNQYRYNIVSTPCISCCYCNFL